MTKMAPESCEDLAYTDQWFAMTGIGHTVPTADFGAPTMIWQVATWPRRHTDPYEFNMRDRSSSSGSQSDEKIGLKNNKKIREEYGKLVRDVADSFNDLLLRLQRRGCVAGGDPGPPFELVKPQDWETVPVEAATPEMDRDIGECFERFATDSVGFTVWWPDAPRGEAARSPASELSLLGDGPDHRPRPTDLRVRVQAELNAEFSSITFFLDAGKPWNEEPVDCAEEAEARGLLGKRRKDIFRHIETVRRICENRLSPQDPALVDLAALPERICGVPPAQPPEIAGKSEVECARDSKLKLLLSQWQVERAAWLKHEQAAAQDLLAAADYLYKDVWDEFCQAFDFNLCDIAGRTNEVFANYRGLVMSTNGMTESGVQSASGAAASVAATRPIPRFIGGGGHNTDPVEPKAVVKAFQPFMRRFRSEADWRDWIACTIFDKRAIYITPLGSRSEYRQFDEGEPGTAVPAAHLPVRRTKSDAEDPRFLPECANYIRDSNGYERTIPITYRDDRPAPLHYLILTKHAPNRKLIGRMIERINTTGVRRLFALKNWTVLRQSSIWMRTQGRKLDEVHLQWIRKTGTVRQVYLDLCERRWTIDLARNVSALIDPRIRGETAAAMELRDRSTQEWAIAELSKLCDRHCTERSFLQDLLHPSRKRNRKEWDDIRGILDNLRHEKEKRDITLADINQNSLHELIGISAALDKLGQAAVGGLGFRISRSQYFGELYRSQVENLRDGNIETWWSYSQFAKRGMEPTLAFIENLGQRLVRLNDRLRSVKQDILQSSINNQTESTRDNTHKLERIQTVLGRVANAAERSERQLREFRYAHMLLIILLAGAQLIAVAMFGYQVLPSTIQNSIREMIDDAVKKVPR